MNAARVRDLARLRGNCELAAAGAGWRAPLVLPTTVADPGTELAQDALAAGADLVIAAGGDGTVAACASALAGTGVPLAIVPAGSANLTAHALGIPVRSAPALRAAFCGQDRLVDVGDADGAVFTSMAGIGLDAAVVGAAARPAKHLAGWPAYAAAAVSQLLRRPAEFTIRLDDAEPVTCRAVSVTVGNTGALPGGFRVMPAARPDDGILDVVVLAPAGPLGWADIGVRVAAGSGRDDPHLRRYRARAVEIRADRELPRQLDGEVVAPGTSLAARVLPGALLVRVPA